VSLKLRHAEIEGNTKHERKDPAPTPIFVAGITHLQRLRAAIEQAINRLSYTLKVIISDTIKMIRNKLEYHKTIIEILKEKKVQFHTFQPRKRHAYRVLIRNLHHSVQQDV
jgi:hypothetical protein